MRRSALFLGLAVSTAVAAAACRKDPHEGKPDPKQVPPKPEAVQPFGATRVSIDPDKLKAFAALPAKFEGKTPASDDQIALGKMLYFETRLSKNHDLSCNSCHQLDKYGVDNLKTSPGHKGQLGDRNSPTVYNAAGHFVQFWDGRAADVEEQATGPIQNPVEMASDEKTVVAALESIPEYVDAFKKAYPEDKKITLALVGRAIAAFERTLATPARWDRFLGGDEGALTDAEKKGFETFVATGCTTCHSGALVGGQMYQKLGLQKPWASETDLGRHKVTNADADKMVFKVPSLRNIEKTAPYFHDGSVATLEDAVAKMASHQLGKELSGEEVRSIVAWLKTLTGPLPKIEAPTLPKSTDKTPKADPS